MKRINKIRTVNIGLIIFISFMYLIGTAKAVESLIASDLTDDIYRVKREDFEDIADKITDGKSITVEKADELYENIDSLKDSEGKQVDSHNVIDIKSCSFDEENDTFYMKMCSSDFELNKDEIISGIFYTAEHIYYMLITKDNLIYAEHGKETHTIKDIDSSLAFSKDISENINDEEFLKIIIVYYEEHDANYVYVELFDSTAGTNYLIFLIWIVLMLFLMAIVIIIYYYYKSV